MGAGGGSGERDKIKTQREQIRKSPMDNNFWKTIQIKQSRESQTPEYTREEDADPVRENPDNRCLMKRPYLNGLAHCKCSINVSHHVMTQELAFVTPDQYITWNVFFVDIIVHLLFIHFSI